MYRCVFRSIEPVMKRMSERTQSIWSVGTPAVAAGLIALLLPQPASAHIIAGAQGGFGSGFAHPLTGVDHFLAMFAVGLWGAQMGGRRV
jgi:hydrogenase/urease accessory protein HupE